LQRTDLNSVRGNFGSDKARYLSTVSDSDHLSRVTERTRNAAGF